MLTLFLALAPLQAPTLQDLEQRLTALQAEVAQLQAARSADAAALQRREAEIAALLSELEQLSGARAAVPPSDPLAQAQGLPSVQTPHAGGSANPLTLGGYGEAHFNAVEGGGRDQIDIHRFVVYLGYAFSDWIQFHSETELEHAFVEDGNGEVKLEQFYVDFLTGRRVSWRTGRMLAPLGIVNLRHEPPTFNGVERPAVETFVLPSTWSLDGAAIFGELSEDWQYQLALTGGMDGSGFSDVGGIRGGRQVERPGLSEPALSGRLDWRPLADSESDLRLGLSGFRGGLNNGNRGSNPGLDAELSILSADAQASAGRWDFRGVYAYEWIDGARDVSTLTGDTIASDIVGWYLEAGYHCLPENWRSGRLENSDAVVFARYDDLDTQHVVPSGLSANPAGDRTELTFGLGFWPVPNVVLKADYQVRDDDSSVDPADQFNLGFGFWL